MKKILEKSDKDALKSRDEDGMSALHWASDRGHAAVVDLLLAAGANPGTADGEGQTPLHYAASCGHRASAERLLAAGADPGAADSEGETPVDMAADDEMKRLLLKEVK